MNEKARDLAAAFEAGKIGRRELVKRLVGDRHHRRPRSAAIMGEAATNAYAADFDMMAHKGDGGKAAAEQASLCRRDDRRPR